MRARSHWRAGLLVAAALSALTVASVSLAAPATTTKLTATLSAKSEVPKPAVKNAKGTGLFTATLTGRKLVWKLTWSGLTGKATAAHIHLGKVGKPGNVLVPLCAGATCKSGVHGTVTVTASVAKSLLNHGTYVNVHTAKNPGGEIRGQVAP